ncbi:Melatonin- receptor [Desmophyllum pertusum]|uniref:Melatonin- receptor n=1 Tax=Desmophyllum pertusum TaxID=174260 RepID=A0A9X0CNF1_9CNID|nr:Melatonin- receptor [Desmophyllum pertusum]
MSKLEELLKFHNERLSRELASRTTSAIVVESTLTAVVALCASLGNMLVCSTIARNPRLHTPTNVLIFALAMTDVTMSLATMPITTGVLISGRWIYSKEVCLFQGSFPLTLAASSLLLMVVIAVNRYLCVVKPNLYRQVFTTKKSIGFAIGALCLASVPCLSPLFYAREGYQFHPGKAYCAFAMEQNPIFAICMGLSLIITPFIIMSFLYLRIYCSVRNAVFPQGNSNAESQRTTHVQEVKVTKTLAAVLLGFSCCWFSYCGHRPDRYEQWCTNPTATSVLLVRIINLHVLGYKPGVVWAHEPIVSRRIQTNHHLQDCGVKLSMLPT